MRLVLTEGVPGPWGESAKALFDLKGVPYHPVAQKGGAANEELVTWTGHRNAPIAILDDEPPRASWLEILFLAERLGESLPDVEVVISSTEAELATWTQRVIDFLARLTG